MAITREDIEQIAIRTADEVMERIREPVETCKVEIASIPEEKGEERVVAFLTCMTRELKADDGNNGHPGNPHVRLDEEVFQYIRGQMRPKESMSQTIARLTTGERLVEENLLTPTENEVLSLAAEDLSNREIAERLGISPDTVRVHFLDIRRKIGVPTREEAVAAFGEPTVRERVPIAVLREPLTEEERIRLQTLRYEAAVGIRYPLLERRAASLLTLVDEIERQPAMETVRRLENELVDLVREVGKAQELARGREAVTLSSLHGRLEATIRDIAPVRAALTLMEQETLPMRIEAAERSLLSAIRVLRESFLGWTELSPHLLRF